MEIVDKYESNGITFFTIQLAENVFVDIKVIGSLRYIMQCEDGRMAYNDRGDSLDYEFDEDVLIALTRR